MNTWPEQPYCGAEYGRKIGGIRRLAGFATNETAVLESVTQRIVVGYPVICDNPTHKTTGKNAMKHRNSELGFEWW